MQLSKRQKISLGIIGLIMILIAFAKAHDLMAMSQNTSPAVESTATRNNDGIISITFKSSGGNSGYGSAVIIYKTTNNETKEFSFRTYPTELKDIDGDGIREIIVPKKLGSELDIPSYQRMSWYDIYHFDRTSEKLVLVSGEYPQYYKEIYIPKVQQEIKDNPDFSSIAIKARGLLINMAQDVVEGKYKPTENESSSAENRFNFLIIQMGLSKQTISTKNDQSKEQVGKQQEEKSQSSPFIGHWRSSSILTYDRNGRTIGGYGNLFIGDSVIDDILVAPGISDIRKPQIESKDRYYYEIVKKSNASMTVRYKNSQIPADAKVVYNLSNNNKTLCVYTILYDIQTSPGIYYDYVGKETTP